MTKSSVVIESGDDSFPSAAAGVMSELTSALSAMFESCDAVSGNRPIDISRGLGIDMKLAWKASHLANSAGPFDAVRHLPGAAGMRILVDAVTARGGDEERIDRATRAFDEVRGFISRSAGSRRAFESMVSGIDGSRDRRLEEEHRRLLFDGASSVWGMRADTIQRLDVLFPSSIDGLLDCVTLRGLRGMRRLRGGVSLPFFRPRIIDDRGQETKNMVDEPIDPQVKPGDLPIVSELCEGAVPSFPMRRVGQSSIYEASALDGADPGPFTIVTGETLRAVQPTKVSSDTHGIFQLMRLRIPAELAVFDILVHDDLLEAGVEPDTYLASDLHGPVQGVGDVRRVRVPVPLRAEPIATGTRPAGEGLIDVDRMLGLAMDAAKERLDHFRWFRIRLSYPPISTTIAFECEQPSG